MKQLDYNQKQLIFDYALGLAEGGSSGEASELISANAEAADLYESIKAVLAPLDTVAADSCPDDLVERTILRLKNIAGSGHSQLEDLLATEQSRTATPKARFWPNVTELLATAAVILFFTGALVAPLNVARQKSWQTACQMQLQRIWQGMQTYSNDHEDRLPSVSTAAGAPWWKVGYQGRENHSNTRNLWLLAKKGYVSPSDFVCPGRRQGKAIQFDPSRAPDYNDFPERKYITYSCRMRPAGSRQLVRVRRVLMSDMNPVFEHLPQDFGAPLRIQLDKVLARVNSHNHNKRGQNLLFDDGSAKFTKTRYLKGSEDDIFTLNGTTVYQGVELPSCDSDAFLAP